MLLQLSFSYLVFLGFRYNNAFLCMCWVYLYFLFLFSCSWQGEINTRSNLWHCIAHDHMIYKIPFLCLLFSSFGCYVFIVMNMFCGTNGILSFCSLLCKTSISPLLLNKYHYVQWLALPFKHSCRIYYALALFSLFFPSLVFIVNAF